MKLIFLDPKVFDLNIITELLHKKYGKISSLVESYVFQIKTKISHNHFSEEQRVIWKKIENGVKSITSNFPLFIY